MCSMSPKGSAAGHKDGKIRLWSVYITRLMIIYFFWISPAEQDVPGYRERTEQQL